MLDPRPRWTYSSPTDLTRDYGSVRLVDGCAVGQWYCLESDSGRLRWANPALAANTVFAVSEGVIVAHTIDSSGPTTTHAGGCGISLKTGALLWELPSSAGLAAFLWHLVRGRVDELAPNLVAVQGHECACTPGRIIDIHGGHEVRVERDLRVWHLRQRIESARWLGFRLSDRAYLPNGDWITVAMSEREPDADGLLLRRVAQTGETMWSFQSIDHKACCRNVPSRLGFHGDYAYLLVTDRPVPVSGVHQPGTRRDWSLWVLDLRSGDVVQRVTVAVGTRDDYRLEDIDEHHMLLARSRRHLVAYAVRNGSRQQRAEPCRRREVVADVEARREETVPLRSFKEAYRVLLFETEEEYIDYIVGASVMLDASPRNGIVLINRGVALRELGDVERALDDLGRAIEALDNPAIPHANTGDLLRRLGRDAEAIDHYGLALSYEPADPRVRRARGHLLHRLHRFDDAMQDYEVAILAEPDFERTRDDRDRARRGPGPVE